ncbi:hypothetical protein RAB80_010182, partial [Fusarium oxysporum f. sp. vasinfectum]
TRHPSRQSTNARRGLIIDLGLQSGLIVQTVWTIRSAGYAAQAVDVPYNVLEGSPTAVCGGEIMFGAVWAADRGREMFDNRMGGNWFSIPGNRGEVVPVGGQ